MLSSHLQWLSDLAYSLEIQTLDVKLLSMLNDIITVDSNIHLPFESLLEFSVVADNTPEKSFRYEFDVSKFGMKEKSLLETGIKCLGVIPEDHVFHSMLNWTSLRNSPLDFIGAEHSCYGNFSRFKTYWNSQISLENIFKLMPSDEAIASERIFSKMQELFPLWNRPRFIGVDLLVSGTVKVKVYYPHRNSTESLSLITFSSLLERIGLDVDVDKMAKLAYSFFNKKLEVLPTAFIVGLVLGRRPSVKLEIASKAYFKSSKEALRRASMLAVALDIDPTPFYKGLNALQKFSPLKKIPDIEVICIEFLPNFKNRMIMYYKL